ncbi:FecR family protein [Parapedobacter luteus]|uniref:FecR family protein n=1 Tax=Parapedobacter luteus TaxID=623280 RepID=A0A1T4ZZT1_9SPHI|nr:FecR domain-containing protein [Parapedobacter luteus]SKB28291.1 FecR family protein [Parapedobacter luteus]
MNKQQFDELFRRYIAEELSDEERKAFFALLGDAAKQDEIHGAMQRWWDDTERFQDMPVDADGRRRIRQVMERISPSPPRRLIRPWWQWVAAACLVLVSFFLFRNNSPSDHETALQTLAVQEITALHGQKKQVRMPDGSVIHLNGGSTLQYDDGFNKSVRMVKLVGEAFFEVTPNPDKPFIVSTAPLYTTVVGTSFNVRAREGDSAIHVVVTEGSVRVGQRPDSLADERSQVILSPSERFTYKKKSGDAAIDRVNALAEWTAWKDGVLVFQNQSFEEVAQLLERWYGVQVRFRNERLKRYRFTGEFVNLPINKVLDLLQSSSGFTYTLEGKQVYLQ